MSEFSTPDPAERPYRSLRHKPAVVQAGWPTLKKLRIQAGLTVYELSDRAAMSATWITAIEHGTKNMVDIPFCIGVRLADALGADVHELLK